MGYTTDFTGRFRLNKELTRKDFQELESWNDERHDSDKYPSHYCQWKPSSDGWSIEWDEVEKFYSYVEWIEWLIKNWFAPKGYILNGEVEWEGEEQGDVGKIIIKDNVVTTKTGKIVYE